MKLRSRKKRFKTQSWRGGEGFFVVWGRRTLFLAAILGIAVFFKWNSSVNRTPVCIDCDIVADSVDSLDQAEPAHLGAVALQDKTMDEVVQECAPLVVAENKLSYLTLDSRMKASSIRASSKPKDSPAQTVVAQIRR